ncbi:MAG: glycosyltransferase family 4 protein [Patescibacteria group bacterium]|jgi:glycosyltransferase involved in cell wall biosynthesis
MKIIFFSPYFYPYISGMTVYPQLVLKELNKKHDIEILTFKHDRYLTSKDSLDGLAVYRMPFLCKISKGFISPQSIIIFFKKIKKKELLIINLPSVEGLFLVFLAKLLGVKVLAIFHCQIDLGPGLIGRVLSLLVNSLVKVQLLLAEKIVAFSADYIDSLSWSNKLKNKVVYIKPVVRTVEENFRTLKKFKEKRGKQYWIGFVGRISREKGLDYLIEAIKILPNSERFTLVFVGPNNEQVAGENKYYLDFIKKLKTSQINYLFLGLLAEKDLFSFYKSIDLLVLPSINSTEAYGLVQLEAMSVGTPVVTSNLPGIREPIQQLKMGKLVPPQNVEKLSLAIIEVIDLKFKQKFIKQEKIIGNFISKKRAIEEYEKIFHKI